MGGGSPRGGGLPTRTPGYGDQMGGGNWYDPLPKAPNWMDGGSKFTAKDAIGLALMSLGDSANGGNMSQMMLKGRMGAMEKAREAQLLAQQREQVYSDLMKQGATPEVARLMALNPEAVGTNFASHAGAYSLGKGDVRMNNNKVVAERPDMFETPAGDRRAAYADGRTEEIYRNEDPKFLTTQNGVYALDPHSGSQFGGGQGASTPPGTIEDGYQFLGGDDADPNNWKPVGGAGPASAPRPFPIPRIRR